MVDELQILLSSAPRFDHTNYQKIRPVAGLDIAFQKGETYTRKNGEVMDRIVRIGFTNNLLRRITFHYEGDNASSVFRANVGEALGDKTDEAAVTGYFAENISFAIIPNGEVLKARLIATLFQDDTFYSSAGWLGEKAGMNKLWQTNNLNGPVLNRQQVFQLRNLMM